MPVIDRIDFDTYITGGLTIENDDPSLGLHCIKSGLPADSPTLNVAAKEATIPTQGYLNGRLTLTFSVATLASASQRVGLLCLQSQRDMAQGGGGMGYALYFSPSSKSYTLFKLTDGFRNSPVELDTTTVTGDPTTITLIWLVSPLADWTLLLGQINGVTQVAYQDFDSPYTTGVAEGYLYDDGASGQDFDLTFLAVQLEADL